MTSFEQYLLEQNIVSEVDLLQCLLDVTSSKMTPAEAVFRGQLLTPKQQVDAILYQAEHRLDYKSSLIALDLFSPELSERIGQAVQRSRKPLGASLLEHGKIDLQGFSDAIDRYRELKLIKLTADDSARSCPLALAEEYSSFVRAQILPLLELSSSDAALADLFDIAAHAADLIGASIFYDLFSAGQEIIKNKTLLCSSAWTKFPQIVSLLLKDFEKFGMQTQPLPENLFPSGTLSSYLATFQQNLLEV